MLVPTQQSDLTRPANPPVSLEEIAQMVAVAETLVVNDGASSIRAQESKNVVTAARKAIKAWGQPAKDAALAAKRDVDSYVGQFFDPVEAAEKKLAAKILAYAQDVKRQNEEAERQRQQAVAEAAPWEREEMAASPIPMTPIPIVTGNSIRKKPAEARIVDPAALLRWVLEDPKSRIPEFVEFKRPALNAKARALGREVEALIPGVQYVQEETLSGR